MKESALYERIGQFAESTLECMHVKQQVGTRLGRIDVAGLRELHGDFETDTEIVAIEVKEERAAFLNAIGQAFAYSVYAHRCYLAVRKRNDKQFSRDELQVAAQFGVGLIEIGDGENTKIRLTSSRFSPENRYVLDVLHKLSLFRCSLCRAVYPEKEISEINKPKAINLAEDPAYIGNLSRIIKKRRNAMYYLYEVHSGRNDARGYVYDRRYLCKDCISILASLGSTIDRQAG